MWESVFVFKHSYAPLCLKILCSLCQCMGSAVRTMQYSRILGLQCKFFFDTECDSFQIACKINYCVCFYNQFLFVLYFSPSSYTCCVRRRLHYIQACIHKSLCWEWTKCHTWVQIWNKYVNIISWLEKADWNISLFNIISLFKQACYHQSKIWWQNILFIELNSRFWFFNNAFKFGIGRWRNILLLCPVQGI